MNKVQFDHDSRIDLLTGAQMPTNFYRALNLALAVRRRNGGALFIITIKVLPPAKKYKRESPASFHQVTYFENLLKNASNLISSNLRAQDSFTRMAIDGFYILISGEKSEELNLVERFKRLFADRASYKVESSKLEGNLSALDWLNEIDEIYFNS